MVYMLGIKQPITYTISDAIIFLQKEYGAENMPTSEETLRRAVRSNQLRVQENGDPGRKGYTIREEDLRAYAKRRLDRIRSRKRALRESLQLNERNRMEEEKPLSFPELCQQRLDGSITSEQYYVKLYSEKMKWESKIAEKQEELKRLEVQKQIIENEILTCESAINAYIDGIAKYTPE